VLKRAASTEAYSTNAKETPKDLESQISLFAAIKTGKNKADIDIATICILFAFTVLVPSLYDSHM
jgi:hypothetical protein